MIPRVLRAAVFHSILTCSVLCQSSQDLQCHEKVLRTPSAYHQPSAQVLVRVGQLSHSVLRKIIEDYLAGSLTPESARTALYVAGRQQAHAAALLSCVRDCMAFAQDAGIRRQALWALGQIGGSCFESGSRASHDLIRFIEGNVGSDVDVWLLRCVFARLHMGAHPEVPLVVQGLFGSLDESVAAAESAANMLTRHDVGSHLRDPLVDALSSVVASHVEFRGWEWDRPVGLLAYSRAAEALAATGIRSRNTLVALLAHFDPSLRLHALDHLASEEGLSLQVRRALALRLLDKDRQVRDRALAIVAALGDRAAVALPLLAYWSRGNGDRAFCAGCRRTGARLARECGQATMRLWEQLIADNPDDGLRIDGGDNRMSEIVMGYRGWGDERLTYLARVVKYNELLTVELANEFVACIGNADRKSEVIAFRALEELGPALLAYVPSLPVLVLRSAEIGCAPSYTAAHIDAWVSVGANSSLSAIRTAMESPKWYIVCRGLSALCATAPLTNADCDNIERVLDCKYDDVEIRQGATWSEMRGRGHAKRTLSVDYRRIRALAAVALEVAGKPWSDRVVLRAAISEMLGVDVSDVPLIVKEKCRGGGAGDLARLLEGRFGQPWWHD